MATEIQCPKCYSQKGFPGIEQGDGKCAECYGTGAATVAEAVFDAFNILTSERSKCLKCQGTGICQTCHGTGVIEVVVPSEETRERRREPNERPPSSSTPETMDGATCLFWALGLVAAAIAVLFAVLTVIVTMPIWVGAIAVSVITAYLYSGRRIREIAPAGLQEARLIQVQRKKRIRVKVACEFLQTRIRWNPDLLIAGGSGILYALLVGGILVVYNADRIGKTMFGIAAVAGSILAWKSGRKILELRISEAVLTARQIPSTGPRTAAQIGFGLSCAAACVILFLIIASLVNGPAPIRPPRPQVVTQPGSPIPTRTIRGTLPQTNVPFRKVPASSPQPVESSHQPPRLAQTTPTSVPSPATEEQPHAFIDQSQNLTASPPPVSSNVSEFVARVIELEETQQIEAILGNYASRVRYFDNGIVDQAFIRKDKSDYFSRWPVRSYEIIGEVSSKGLGQNLWEIRVPTKFHVVNHRGEWIDGDVIQVLTVNTSNPHWLITAEDGEVKRREKGTGQRPAGDPQADAASGSSQAIGGGAFRGKGAVYRIPDLKNLAGKELSNAWLYGEFAFESQNGDTAACRTAVTVLFVGKGTTKVNIEFERGFSVSNRILMSMRDPQLPLTFMLRASPKDPIRLLRVRQNRDGTLEAFARSPIRLDMQ